MRVLLVHSEHHFTGKYKEELDDLYVLDVANNGEDGAFMSHVNDYDAIVIDSELPDVSCLDVCRKTRQKNVRVPILMLLNSGDLDLKISSLDFGADAVLTKPISTEEIKAYLRSLIKRYLSAGNNVADTLKAQNLELNYFTKKVFRAGKEIKLRRKEFDVLEYLLLNKGKVVTKEMLLEKVWDDGICVRSNTLEVHIKSLRDKIDRNYENKIIKTVYGFGYKIR